MSKFFQTLGLKEKKPTISTTCGDLTTRNLKSGYFSKRGPTRGSKYNVRYWILTDTHLFYFTSAGPTEHALGMIDLKNCKLVTDGYGPNEFAIISATSEKTREYFCKTDSKETRTAWGSAIQACISKLNAGRQTYAGSTAFVPSLPRVTTMSPTTSSYASESPASSTASTSSSVSNNSMLNDARSSSLSPRLGNGQLSPTSGFSSPNGSTQTNYTGSIDINQMDQYNSARNTTTGFEPTLSPRTLAASQPHITQQSEAIHDANLSSSSSRVPDYSSIGATAGKKPHSSVFGVPGPVEPFKPQGCSEIIRVFMADNSSKTVIFNTSLPVQDLVNLMVKKLVSVPGPFLNDPSKLSNFCIFTVVEGTTLNLLPLNSRLIDSVSSWPTKNDPQKYRIVFQPAEEAERNKASAVGFLTTQTNAATQSTLPKSSSFVSQVMGAIINKHEWVGNVPLSSLKAPFTLKGNLAKKSSSSITSKTSQKMVIIDHGKLYYFEEDAQPMDKSKGWIPLANSALLKDKSPLGFSIFFTFPGTLDHNAQIEFVCKNEEEKSQWVGVLSGLCKGTLPAKAKAIKPTNKPQAANSKQVKTDLVKVLDDQSKNPESPKLVHLTAGRPKGAGRPPSGIRAPIAIAVKTQTDPSPIRNYEGDFIAQNSMQGGSSPSLLQGQSSNPPVSNLNLNSNSTLQHHNSMINLPGQSSITGNSSPKAGNPTPLGSVAPFFSSSQGSIGSSPRSPATQNLAQGSPTNSPRTVASPRPSIVPAAQAPPPLTSSGSISMAPSMATPTVASSTTLPTVGYTTPLQNSPLPVVSPLPTATSMSTIPTTNSQPSSPLMSQQNPALKAPQPVNSGHLYTGAFQAQEPPKPVATTASINIMNPSNHVSIAPPTYSKSPSTVPSTGYVPAPGSFGAFQPTNPGFLVSSQPTPNPALSATAVSEEPGNRSSVSLGPFSSFSAPFSNPALSASTSPGPFVPFQSNAPSNNPTKPGVTTIYSPVLSKPMPVPATNPSLQAANNKPNSPSSAFFVSTTTTIAPQPHYYQQQQQQPQQQQSQQPTQTVQIAPPTPLLVPNEDPFLAGILNAPMDISPFDDIPFD